MANGEGGEASMDVFDTILQDIETFTGDLAQGTAKTDPAQQEVNGECIDRLSYENRSLVPRPHHNAGKSVLGTFLMRVMLT